jgi:uncharacterized membrane protein
MPPWNAKAAKAAKKFTVPSVRLQLISTGFVVAAVLVAAPIMGWPPVVRLPAVVVPGIVVAILAGRPWQWDESRWNAIERWQPRTRTITLAAIAIALLLFWLVLTRFRSGVINGVDFTVYFDRPCYQTIYQGHPLFVETADVPSFSNRSELVVHAFWAMFPICAPYAIYATPYWLLSLSVVAVVAGAVHVFRIARELEWGGVLAGATALAFVLNDNMARTLSGGFHPEVLYAWFIPWLLDAGIRGARASYVAAAFACVLVKEDACLVLFASAMCLVLVRGQKMTRGDRLVFLVLPTAIALLNLAVFYRFVVPALTADGRITYAAFWSNYGPTPVQAIKGMVSHPWRVVAEAVTSGFFPIVMSPHLFLPLIGWRWLAGATPIVALYGASANPQLRAFGIYYAIVLVPFLALGASSGGAIVARRFVPDRRALTWAAAIVALGALLVGSGRAGYSLRPWRADIAAVPEAVSLLGSERVLLVQSGLYPHAGYSPRVQLLTPYGLRDPRNTDAALLIAPEAGGYPFSREELHQLARLPVICQLPAGLVAVRNRRPSVSSLRFVIVDDRTAERRADVP